MKVFSVPDDIAVPQLEDAFDANGRYNMNKDDANRTAFLTELKTKLTAMGYNGPLTGEIVRFPMGDGYAEYMVIESGRTTGLVHLPLGDAWNLPEWQLRGLNKTEIRRMIAGQKRLDALFGRTP